MRLKTVSGNETEYEYDDLYRLIETRGEDTGDGQPTTEYCASRKLIWTLETEYFQQFQHRLKTFQPTLPKTFDVESDESDRFSPSAQTGSAEDQETQEFIVHAACRV